MGTSSDLISIVVPVFNEEENLVLLHERVRDALEPLSISWELLFVDDGSTDGSRRVLHDVRDGDSRVKAILFSRNFGQDAALTAGLHAAKGAAVVLMDADLQDPPELIVPMMERWREGCDIVAARRTSRRGETTLKRFTSYLWHRTMAFLAGSQFTKDTGDFQLMDRAVVQAFRQYNQYNRFVRSLIASTGFRQAIIDFDRPPRHAGTTKYSLRKSLGLAATSIMNSSVAPLRLALWVGLLIMLASVVGIAHWIRMALSHRTVPGWASLVISVWFLGGVQCVLLGIVGEYVGRTYIESQRRPIYIVQETLGIEADALSARDDAS